MRPYSPSKVKPGPARGTLLRGDELLVGELGHEQVVLLLAEPVLPGAALLDEVGRTDRRRAVPVGEGQRDLHNLLTVGFDALRGIDVVDHGAVVREPLVLGEPLLLCKQRLRLGVQVIVGVGPITVVLGWCQ